MTTERLDALLKAAERMDWMQPFFTQADPCFHLADDGYFCGRAPRWHDDYASHAFLPLADLLRALAGKERIKDLESFVRDVRDNYDHDEDAHKYKTRCRACEAEKLVPKPERRKEETT